jgi:hypothetical protein
MNKELAQEFKACYNKQVLYHMDYKVVSVSFNFTVESQSITLD